MNWGQWYRLASYSRSSLWIVPFIAVLIEQVVIRLTDYLNPLLGWEFYGVGVIGAQGALDVIITMNLSFIVFTFGSLLVAIQVASGQLTPRIIATTLLRDDVIRYTVGLFVFTLLYGIGIRARTETSVNELGMALTVASGLGCIVAFLFLIDYAARLLRPVAILSQVGETGLTVIENVYSDRLSRVRDEPEYVTLPNPPHQILYHQGNSGIVLAVNLRELMAEAQRRDCIIEFMSYVGDFVAVDEPLFQIFGGETIDEERLRSAVAFGPERTMEQDPMFSFRIIVDIAIKALSKAINDPTTAVLAIDQLHRLLRMVGRRHTQNEQLKDADGKLRVVWRTPNWEDFVRLACVEIRTYGAENMQIARRLRAMLENLILTLPERRHPALRTELELLDRSIDHLYPFPQDATAARVADSQGLGASGSGNRKTA